MASLGSEPCVGTKSRFCSRRIRDDGLRDVARAHRQQALDVFWTLSHARDSSVGSTSEAAAGELEPLRAEDRLLRLNA